LETFLEGVDEEYIHSKGIDAVAFSITFWSSGQADYSEMWNLYERSQLQAPLSSDLFCFLADSAEIYE